jgi:hypothetical protein
MRSEPGRGQRPGEGWCIGGSQCQQISIGNEHSKLSSALRRQSNHPLNTAGSYLYNDGSSLPNRWIDLSGATARSSLRTRRHTDLRRSSQQQYQQQVQSKDIKQTVSCRVPLTLRHRKSV